VQKGTDTTAFTTCASAPLTWRPRSFTYDPLSRLLSASNPESGTISYTYDANSNVVTKTAPSPNQPSTGTATVVTTYTYDTLNRLTGKSYADSYTSNAATPAVKYGYDGVALTGCTKAPPSLPDTYPIGRRTSMCDGSGATSWDHDPMGRTMQDKRFIGSIAAAMFVNYGYNFDGSMSFLTTPPEKFLAYQIGGAGRALSVKDTTDTLNFVTSATYAPTGGLQTLTGGGVIHAALAYNSRLQPTQLFFGTNTPPAITSMTTACPSTVGNIMNKTYGFGFGTVDNGNVLSITNCRDTSRNEAIAYDGLNRIASAQSGGTLWGETFSIDTWGNLTGEGPVTGKTNHEGLNTTADTNNRLVGFGYDPAGNMTSNTALSATYIYDAENRLIWTSGDRYVYDGDGNRVEKCVAATSTTPCPTSGTNGTLYFRGMGSDTQEETDLSGNPVEQYIFFNGARIARRDVTSTGATIAVHYYFSDQVGSHSVVTNAAGTALEQDIDYYPYGGVEHDYCTACVAQRYKFNGKERDTESGLDNFGARYDTSSLGRFMTPDWAEKPTSVPYANFGNPQSLNLYSYVQNNPATLRDVDGHCFPWCLAAAGVGVLADEAPLAFTGPVGWIIIGGTAATLTGIAAYQHFHSSESSGAAPPAPPTPAPGATTEQGRDAQGKFVPKQPGQTQPGAKTEKETLAAEGATRTGTALPGTNRRVDGTVTAAGQKIEVKSGGSVNNTEQLKATGQASQAATGQPLLVVTTNPNVKVSGPAQQNGNLEIRPAKNAEPQ